MNLLVDVKGIEELKRELRKAPGLFIAAMADELPREGELLKTQATALAPSASGTLKNSALVTKELPKGNRGRVRVAVAYTDEKAAAVHEGVHWNHHVKGTHGFKWFERAFNAFQGAFLGRIVEKLQGVLGGMGR